MVCLLRDYFVIQLLANGRSWKRIARRNLDTDQNLRSGGTAGRALQRRARGHVPHGAAPVGQRAHAVEPLGRARTRPVRAPERDALQRRPRRRRLNDRDAGPGHGAVPDRDQALVRPRPVGQGQRALGQERPVGVPGVRRSLDAAGAGPGGARVRQGAQGQGGDLLAHERDAARHAPPLGLPEHRRGVGAPLHARNRRPQPRADGERRARERNRPGSGLARHPARAGGDR